MVLALPGWTGIREFRFISNFFSYFMLKKVVGFFLTRAKPIFSSFFVNQFSLLIRLARRGKDCC
jgi:hypothetical protein